jgi:DNA-binding GntR family transcriptional regulator
MPSPLTPPSGRAFQTKQAMVYHTLREAIVQTRLQPGERLVIDDLAAQLAVSSIPVREALQLLQAERLVEQKPHVGAVVAAITPDSAREIFALLECLEQAVFRGAIEYATPGDLATLTALVERMAGAANDGRWLELNRRFHRTIAEIARMPRALDLLDRVCDDWERLRRHRFRDVGHPDTSAAEREHRAMISALAERSAPRLEALVRQHNRAALAFYLEAADAGAQAAPVAPAVKAKSAARTAKRKGA